MLKADNANLVVVVSEASCEPLAMKKFYYIIWLIISITKFKNYQSDRCYYFR